MMDKERLEEIKEDVKMTRKDLSVSPSNEMTLHMGVMLNSMDYLIERVQELEGANTRLLEAFDTKTRVHESLLKDYAALKERVQELEQKLKYAETDLALAERLLKNEKRHKLTYRKVAQRYQGEKNRYREALEKILSVEKDDEFNQYAYMMLEIMDEARKALEEESE